jgi:hypothetical protein
MPDAPGLAFQSDATRGGLPAFVSLPPADPKFVARRNDSAEQ